MFVCMCVYVCVCDKHLTVKRNPFIERMDSFSVGMSPIDRVVLM